MSSEITCILHLGAHKTGTSLIQKFLRDRPEAVAKLNAALIGRSETNHLIGWGEVPQRDPNLLRQSINSAANGVELVVLSHENSLGRPLISGRSGIYPDATPAIRGLRDAIDLNTRVIYYIRNQAEFLESYYLQTIHEGSYAKFDDWVGGIDLNDLSWGPLVASLRRSFGSDRVAIADFAYIAAGQNAFIESFLDLVKPGHGIVPMYSAKRNLSISQQGLEIALAINPLLESASERKATRKFLQRHYNNSDSARPHLLTVDQRSELESRYKDENQDLMSPRVDVS